MEQVNFVCDGRDEYFGLWGVCKNCGETVIWGSNYCNHCGAKLYAKEKHGHYIKNPVYSSNDFYLPRYIIGYTYECSRCCKVYDYLTKERKERCEWCLAIMDEPMVLKEK